jgi:hypothetical protein
MSETPIKNNLILELHVPDFQPVRKFYALFGFKEILHDPISGEGGDLGYLVLEREDPLGGSSLNFYGDEDIVTQHAHFNRFDADTPRGYGVEITIPVSDVEGLWQSVNSQLDEENISQSLVTKRWGKQDFRVIDPFGFYVRFTELVDWGQHEN